MKMIEGVPKTISRAEWLEFFERCGLNPRQVRSLTLNSRGVYAEVYETTAAGYKVVDQDGPVVNTALIGMQD